MDNKSEETTGSNNNTALWILLVGVPIIFAIVYFKMQTDDAITEVKTEKVDKGGKAVVAVPDTSVAEDAVPVVKDMVVAYDTVEHDTRSAMEAGDEDGYWDGWYDGAETGECLRYDDKSNFETESEREVYAVNYREGYEKGFDEAMKEKKSKTQAEK